MKRTVGGTELGERGLHEEESGDKKLSREMSSPLLKKEAAGKKGYPSRASEASEAWVVKRILFVRCL